MTGTIVRTRPAPPPPKPPEPRIREVCLTGSPGPRYIHVAPDRKS